MHHAGTRYIIESRNPDGSLDLKGPQPESKFSMACISPGMTSDEIAKVVYRHDPDATLDGRYIAKWPAILHPTWVARVKTWTS